MSFFLMNLIQKMCGLWILTSSPLMMGNGLMVVGWLVRLSLKVYSTTSVPMMVQHEPSFNNTLFLSLGHGDAYTE